MRVRHVCAILLAASGLWAGLAGNADAQSVIGSAIHVDNRVEGELGQSKQTIAVASSVRQNERIITYLDSSASFELADKTTLSVGAGSEIVLDQLVYNPNRGTREVVMSAVSGAFRFVTGVAGEGDYKVLTPVAAIGIRGTDFDVYTTASATLVLAREGVPFACPLWMQDDLDPENGGCCTLSAGDGPVYGIVTRRSRGCVGPRSWNGTNPGYLLRQFVSNERQGRSGSEGGGGATVDRDRDAKTIDSSPRRPRFDRLRYRSRTVIAWPGGPFGSQLRSCRDLRDVASQGEP